MATEEDDPEMAAKRLEAALDRIARAAVHAAVAPGRQDDMNAGWMAARLDSLIGRLRAELDRTA